MLYLRQCKDGKISLCNTQFNDYSTSDSFRLEFTKCNEVKATIQNATPEKCDSCLTFSVPGSLNLGLGVWRLSLYRDDIEVYFTDLKVIEDKILSLDEYCK